MVIRGMPSVSIAPIPKIGDRSNSILREVTNGRALPYQMVWLTNNSALACMTQCEAFGYPVSGTEVRPYTSPDSALLITTVSMDKNAVSYIFLYPAVIDVDVDCGDLTDISKTMFVNDTQCNMACTGDPLHYCGAGNRLTLYTWKGTMNVWHTPENTGWYEVRARAAF